MISSAGRCSIIVAPNVPETATPEMLAASDLASREGSARSMRTTSKTSARRSSTRPRIVPGTRMRVLAAMANLLEERLSLPNGL
jgi:hypothetical protein